MRPEFLDYLVGVPLDQILAEHSISKSTFYRRLKKVKIPKRENFRFFPLQLVLMKLDYEGGETIKSIATRFDSAEATVNKALCSVGTIIRTTSEVSRRYSDAEVGEAIRKYQGGLSAVESGPSEATVLRWLKDRGIEARQQPDYGGKKDFFRTLDSQLSLYWFGFLCADGSIAKKRYVEVNLALKDWGHLELLKQDIDYSKPVKKVEQFNKKRGKMEQWANLLIGSADMARDLARHGMLQIKKGNPDPLERLTDEQLRTFILGYFDGDGSIYLVKYKDPKKPFYWRWYICCEHKTIPEYLLSRCPVVERYNARWSGTVWRTEYGGNQIVPRICEWLYEGQERYLTRKFDLASEAGMAGKIKNYQYLQSFSNSEKANRG
jgi:hypothetical protein